LKNKLYFSYPHKIIEVKRLRNIIFNGR